MEEVSVLLDDNNKGAINLVVDHQKMGFIDMTISKKILTVSHTEVFPEGQGKGYARKLLTAIVEYARKEDLMIIPECTYVESQYERHQDQFSDV